MTLILWLCGPPGTGEVHPSSEDMATNKTTITQYENDKYAELAQIVDKTSQV